MNYHEKMIRYQFRVPPKTSEHGHALTRPEWLQKCQRYLKAWIELIYTEKMRQSQISKDMWAPSLLWEVKSVYDMPIVLWLTTGASAEKKEVQKGKKRTAPDDSHTAQGKGGHGHGRRSKVARR